MKKLLPCLGLLLAQLSPSIGRAAPAVITVDPSRVVSSNFLGFGVNWCPYPWFDISDQAWETCFRRMDYVRPPVVRIMQRAFYYCSGFDPQGRPIYHWDSPEMVKLYRMLDYCEKRGICVIIGEWESPWSNNERSDHARDNLQPLHITENDPRWYRMISDCLEHLLNVKHYTCIKYYNLINEPNGDWSGIADFNKWRVAIEGFHAELQRRGLLQKISIIGPDACQIEDSYWLDLAVRTCADRLGLYDLHLYARKSDVESGWLETFFRVKREFIDRYDWRGSHKPFIISEAGMERTGPCEPQGGMDSQANVYKPIYGIWMADYSVQCARAGLQGVLMWSVDDAEHIMNGDKGWPDVHKTLFKKWGFWNSLGAEIGHPEDENLRPWFYTWSLMSRYFPAGCRILRTADPGVAGVRSLAADVGQNDLTVVLVNDSDRPQDLQLTVLGLKGAGPVRRYDYSLTHRLVDQEGFPVPTNTLNVERLTSGLAVHLPARSFILYTTLR